MRKIWLTVLGFLAVTGPALAQQTPPKNDAKLDEYLSKWQDAMLRIDTLAMQCSRVEDNKVYQTKETYTGTIHFKKPTQVLWNMQKKDKPQEFERFICTGTHVYQFAPAEKVIKVYPAPKAVGNRIAEETSLDFLFGMKADEAKKRYDLSLFKEDKYYIYVDVVPKSAKDKADFIRARIVLNRETYLPRQLWFQQPNKDEVFWDIPNIQANPKLDAQIFAAPRTPQGWKMVQGQQANRNESPSPRIVRPQR